MVVLFTCRSTVTAVCSVPGAWRCGAISYVVFKAEAELGQSLVIVLIVGTLFRSRVGHGPVSVATYFVWFKPFNNADCKTRFYVKRS